MLKPNEVNYLQMIEEREEQFPLKLNDWEQRFIGDILERFSDYGEMLVLSPNQWLKINQVAENLGL